MKRNLLLVIAAAMLTTSSFAQVTEISKWSIGLKGGMSTVRGIDYGSEFERAYNPIGGIFVERTANPFYGIGLDYMYHMNNVDGKLAGLTPAKYTSTIHQIQAFTSINLSNIVAKYRSMKKQKTNLYFVYGLGAGIGSYDDDLPLPGASASESGLLSLSSSFGVNVTRNITKSIEVGLEGKYQWNSNADFAPAGANGFYVADINLRYKLNGVNNTRNISLTDFEKMNSRREGTQEAIDRLQYELARQGEAIKKLEAKESSDSIDGVAIKDIIMGQQYQMDQLTKQLTRTRKDLYRHLNATDPSYLTGDTAQYDISTFGFETGSSKLTKSAFVVLDTILTQLQTNTIWSVKVKGHTDNTGSDLINKPLSERRADAVKKYFVKKGIETKRIETAGFGSSKPIACNDDEAGKAKNRRVEIIINK